MDSYTSLTVDRDSFDGSVHPRVFKARQGRVQLRHSSLTTEPAECEGCPGGRPATWVVAVYCHCLHMEWVRKTRVGTQSQAGSVPRPHVIPSRPPVAQHTQHPRGPERCFKASPSFTLIYPYLTRQFSICRLVCQRHKQATSVPQCVSVFSFPSPAVSAEETGPGCAREECCVLSEAEPGWGPALPRVLNTRLMGDSWVQAS